MDGQRKQPRRSARKNKDQRQQNIGTAIASAQTNDETNNEGWRAFMETYEQYRTHHEHTDDQCKSMVNSHMQSLPTQKKTVASLGIAVPTPIVAGGVSAELLSILEQDYMRARRAGASGAASDVGASSWRVRDHKKMEGAVVGPSLGNGGDDDDGDDVTSVAVSEDTISVGSGYTVRPEEGDDDKSPSSSLNTGPTYMERIKLGSSYLLGLDLGPADFGVLGDAMRATRDASSSAIGGTVGEKRTFASFGLGDMGIMGPLVTPTPFGQSSAKRLKLSTEEEKPQPNRVGWNGLDPNLLHDVFSRLNLREKVRCMGKVCRAWNKLRSRPGLFADLSDDSGPNATGMHKLLEWIPSSAVSGVIGIRLHVRHLDTSHPGWMDMDDDDFYGWKVLEYLAESKPDNMLSGIKSIVFSGPGIEMFGLLGKAAKLGVGSELRSLTLDCLSYRNANSISSQFLIGKNESEFYQLLSSCGKLEELRMPSLLLPKIRYWPQPVPSLLLSIIGPPGTVASDLKVLDLTMGIIDPGEEPDLGRELRLNLEDIGRFCPNLQTLMLPRGFEDMGI